MPDESLPRRQRVHPLFRVRAEIASQREGMNVNLFADVMNLSAEGVCLRSPLEPKAGDELDIYLPLPDHPKPLKTKAQVVWVRPAGHQAFLCGAQFTRPASESRESWQNALTRLLSACRKTPGWELPKE